MSKKQRPNLGKRLYSLLSEKFTEPRALRFLYERKIKSMPNMSPKKNPMPVQKAKERAGNFDEVALGYTAETALDEAARCLNCKNKPCVSGCPVNIDIPAFIAQAAKGNFDGAYDIIAQSSSLPAICGRVCPQENQCEKMCVRARKGEPVGIGRLSALSPTNTCAITRGRLRPPRQGKGR